MAFLNPSYLWALLGLAIPVAIHLWSRKEGRTIKVGSIKFLKESDPKQASSIRINEIWLLVLRMLALTILALLLAGPVIKNKGTSVEMTYLIDPPLFHHAELGRILDTMGSQVEVRLLVPDFPEYSAGDEVNGESITDYWRLAREMKELNSDSIVVFTAGYASGLKGRRPETDQNITWIQIIPDESFDEPIAAVRKQDGIEIISVSGDHSRLEIFKELTPLENWDLNATVAEDSIEVNHHGNEKNIPLRIADTIKVSLFNDEDLGEQMRYIRSSLRAISEYLGTPIQMTDLSIDDAHRHQEDLLVWLSTSSVENSGSPLLLWKPDSLATSLIVQGRRNDIFHLTRELNSENIVEEHLPEQILQILKNNEALEVEIAKYDRRVMPLDEILPVSGSLGGNMERSDYRDISKYFWVLLGIILTAERALSNYRKQ